MTTYQTTKALRPHWIIGLLFAMLLLFPWPAAFAQNNSCPYTVQAGDTLGQIAQRYDYIELQRLYQLNPNINHDILSIGQTINVPCPPALTPTETAVIPTETSVPPAPPTETSVPPAPPTETSVPPAPPTETSVPPDTPTIRPPATTTPSSTPSVVVTETISPSVALTATALAAGSNQSNGEGENESVIASLWRWGFWAGLGIGTIATLFIFWMVTRATRTKTPRKLEDSTKPTRALSDEGGEMAVSEQNKKIASLWTSGDVSPPLEPVSSVPVSKKSQEAIESLPPEPVSSVPVSKKSQETIKPLPPVLASSLKPLSTGFINYVTRGKGKSENENQDAGDGQDKQMYRWIAVADGVGMAKNSALASQTIVSFFGEYVERYAKQQIPVQKKMTSEFYQQASTRIKEELAKKKLPLDSAATTFIGLVEYHDRFVFSYLGDGSAYRITQSMDGLSFTAAETMLDNASLDVPHQIGAKGQSAESETIEYPKPTKGEEKPLLWVIATDGMNNFKRGFVEGQPQVSGNAAVERLAEELWQVLQKYRENFYQKSQEVLLDWLKRCQTTDDATFAVLISSEMYAHWKKVLSQQEAKGQSRLEKASEKSPPQRKRRRFIYGNKKTDI